MDRTRAGVEQVRTFEAYSVVALGPMARQHLVVCQARWPPGSTLSFVKADNTARKTMSLDTQRAGAETDTPENEERLARKIKMQINGSWAEVMVDVSSLRQALGLLLHCPIDSVIFYGRTYSETVGADAEDTDYRASTAPQTEQPRTSPRRAPLP